MNHSMPNDSGLWASNNTWNATSAAHINLLCITLQRSFARGTTAPFASNIVLIGVNSCFSIFAAALNLIVMIVLNRKDEFDTAANLVLKSMALSDFLVGLTVQPLTSVCLILDIYGLDSCKIKLINSSFGIVCVGASMLSATMFSFDRCFATWFPFRYQEHVIYKKYLATIICGWISLLLFASMAFFSVLPRSFLSSLMAISFYFCVLAICICYVMVYKEVRKKKQMIHVIPAITLSNIPANVHNGTEFINDADKVPDASPDINLATTDYDKKKMQNVPHVQRSTVNAAGSSKQASRSYTVIMILSVFLLCYLPATVVKAIARSHVISFEAQKVAFDWANVIALLNSSINPVIYCVRVQKIKDEMKRLLKL